MLHVILAFWAPSGYAARRQVHLHGPNHHVARLHLRTRHPDGPPPPIPAVSHCPVRAMPHYRLLHAPTCGLEPLP